MFLAIASLAAAAACYLSPFPVIGHIFLVGAVAVYLTSRSRRVQAPAAPLQPLEQPARVPANAVPAPIAGDEVAARVARYKEIARERDQEIAAERRQLAAARMQEEEAEELERARLRPLQDKLRVLLFLARDDGAVRGKERDVMVAYLKTQPGLKEANDVWLKTMHTKLGRDSQEEVVEAVARLGSAGQIDQAMIGATEALVKLTKRISPAQLNVLTMLRHERSRGPWRPARGYGASLSRESNQADE